MRAGGPKPPVRFLIEQCHNYGLPVRKNARKGGGSGLLRDPELASDRGRRSRGGAGFRSRSKRR